MPDKRKPNARAQEREVIEYLRHNPYFFVKHMDVLAQMEIPRVQGSPIPLVERRLDQLRERADALATRQQSLEAIALVNERTQIRMHKITLEALAARDVNAALTRLAESLAQDFELEQARVYLFTDELQTHIDPAFVLDRKAAKTLKNIAVGDPMCGILRPAQLVSVFGEYALAVASHVLIPLRRDSLHGLIALGTGDKQRFTADLDTLYLRRLGEMLAAALLRLVT